MGFKDLSQKASARNGALDSGWVRDIASSAPDVDTVHTESASDAHDALSPSPISDDVASPAGRQKRRVNITIATDVHDAMKQAAEEYGTSVSALCLEGWLAIKGRYGK